MRGAEVQRSRVIALWVLALALGLGLGLLVAQPAQAGSEVLYRYVDRDGVMHFTNVPTDRRFARVRRNYPMAPVARRITAYDGLIRRAATRQSVSPALIKAVIAAESNFNPRAVSRKGAVGLMQLMPATAQEMGVSDRYHAEQNVQGGSRYLRQMLNRYGSLRLALAAYNAGPKAVDRYRGVPPYRETREYVRRVMAYYRAYDGDFRQ